MKIEPMNATVNRFRTARGKVLGEKLAEARARLGRDLLVLDVGGRPDYWRNTSLEHVAKVIVLNYVAGELEATEMLDARFESVVGDARDLSDYANGSIDFLHSNSVIEHVGHWGDMQAMARECRRVGRAGWVQTPAWEFPVEPHFRAPFMHWFAAPIQTAMFWLSLSARHRSMPYDQRRQAVDDTNLLSKSEVRRLFPGEEIYVERLILAKSYSVWWLPKRDTGG
ncbi:class I SAM-dependent methyltransferase [Ovoidimarina sediminis]|uniref:class I SAM-dependent methyltransferase n=1 Tax=Ovoidimarina sediminis TaxID=3079856 RepID=UPI002913653E|nr:class I SAM-dependent methyltransferase [Rhodophyticola sp. MJ-SS7]MDU8943270.1 class I SAM-dependent methyltransferase [Rhodophyticola sp. MJ-SS7]